MALGFCRCVLFPMAFLVAVCASNSAIAQLKAGAAAVDISPRKLPVIRNGGFIEATADRIVDPLHARCLVLADGETRLAIVIVDSCMMPVELCDEAKEIATAETKIPLNKITIAATHTHAAPSVMDFTLGSRADPEYTKFLPAKIAEAVRLANDRLAPAKAGWGVANAAHYTKNRRWITRSDKLQVDPFGLRTVHAMMHPGHLNPDYIGPSGPIDPWMTVLKIDSADDEPLAVLANFSMHYFAGHPGISSDYFGRFATKLAQEIAPGNGNFVGIMSQGTSGDLWWGDYSLPTSKKPFDDIGQFANGLVAKAVAVCEQVEMKRDVPLAMAERRLTIGRRLPDEERLKWARRKLELMGDRQPRDRPEVYAQQAVYLLENPTVEVPIQAIRIGEFGIATLPNEVYAITGLKLKAQSPLPILANLSLANGASGYIPPPEQHALGGYTTWPARTAGLELQAEPKIVAGLLELLESVSGKTRLRHQEAASNFSKAVLASKPTAYWRLADFVGPTAKNATDDGTLTFAGQVAYHLPGRDAPEFGTFPHSRAVQLAGGKLVLEGLSLPSSYTLSFQFRLGTPFDFRGTTATLVQRGEDVLSITGNSAESNGVLRIGESLGSTKLERDHWHHVVFQRNGDFLSVYLDGKRKPELSVKVEPMQELVDRISIGGDDENSANLEGRIDELCVFGRAIDVNEIVEQFRAAGFDVVAGNRNELDSRPMSAAHSMQETHVRDGFKLELVAAEPLVRDPVAIDWGADGKLWVAEMADYPMGIDGQGKPGGRIRFLEDSDNDGHYDKSVVFLDGVSFPNGIMAWKSGVLVTAAPEIFYAEDTDGDGKADKREVLYSGFMEGNQQLRVNGLRWGLDNWIHCANGGHHAGFGATNSIHAEKLGRDVALGSRDLRIRPDSGQLEPESGPSQYGRVRDDWGNWFGVQNSMPLWHYAMEDRYLKRNSEVPTPSPKKQVRTPRMPRLFSYKPPQKRFHGFDHAGHYTSACGISIYRDKYLFPSDEAHAFTCAPFHNLVQHHVLSPDGTSFRGERADDGPYDFVASADRWFRPVMSRTGPDGALWIVDMYRYMIEHPEWLPQNGKDELRAGYRAGEKFGRIYRVVRTDRAPRELSKIDSTDANSLVNAVQHPNGIMRDLAHRSLLQGFADNRAVDKRLHEISLQHRNPKVRLQALSLLSGRNKADPELLQNALSDQHAAVRRAAIRIVEDLSLSSLVEQVAKCCQDADATVRMQAALTLGEFSDAKAGRALAELALRSDNDRYTVSAILSSAVQHYPALIDRTKERQVAVSDQILDGLLAMGISRRTELSKLLETVISSESDSLNKWLDLIHDRGLSVESLAKQKDDRLSEILQRVVPRFAKARVVAADSNATLEAQVAATKMLGRQPSKQSEDTVILAKLVESNTPTKVRHAAFAAIRRLDDEKSFGPLVQNWTNYLPSTRELLLDAFLGRSSWSKQLVECLKDETISSLDLSLSQRQRLINSRDKVIAASARTIFGRSTNSERQQVVAEYRGALSLVGNMQRGENVFAKNCKVCHENKAEDSPVGPNLRGLTDRRPESLLVAILDPSRSVEPKYVSYNLLLNSGESVVGVVASETESSLSIVQADGKSRVLLYDSIEQVKRLQVSLMPNGLETKLRPQDVADVIAFLRR